MADPYVLRRFVLAQDQVFPAVLGELRAGRKRTHWMWFVFPQLAGLGHSQTARHFALATATEARAYLAHPVLGPRLTACTGLVLQLEGHSADAVFGAIDSMKFRSSMTLFAAIAPQETCFAAALRTYFHAEPDARTLALLDGEAAGLDGGPA